MDIPQKRTQQVEVNGVLFNRTLTPKFLQALINWKISNSSELSESKWIISAIEGQKTFVVEGWNEVWPFIVSAPCELLQLDDNCHSSIIMDISKTNFVNLKIIDLSNLMIKTVKNNIESIEQLQFMNMPLLEELYLGKTSNKLGENNITKVSALNKCAWNSLKCLDLGRCQQKNKSLINEIEFERMKTSMAVVEKRRHNQFHELQIECESIRMLSKLFFTSIMLKKKKTNLQNKVIKCLKKKKIKFERQ